MQIATSVPNGGNDYTASSQWFSRPDDERFLNLNDLYAKTLHSAENSWFDVVNADALRVSAPTDKPDDLRILVPRKDGEMSEATPNHWSFGQLSSLVQAPAGYLRTLPGTIAGINLQYGLNAIRSEAVKVYVNDEGAGELRAATGPMYGRVYDHEVVKAVMKIAGDGTGTNGYDWAVPQAKHGITKQSTTLYASDRDVFLFLVDEDHPIEIGKLPNGDPDIVYRGFYVWNSEVGSKSLGIATFYYRYVCGNRIIWGVEGYEQICLRHSQNAPARFADEVGPALHSYANANTQALLNGVDSARKAIVAKNDEDRETFLKERGFSRKASKEIIEQVTQDEGHPPSSVWDFVQGITAKARDVGHQDARITMEREANKLLKKVA